MSTARPVTSPSRSLSSTSFTSSSGCVSVSKTTRPAACNWSSSQRRRPCFYDFMTGDPNFANEKPDYLHISTTILPALLEAGVTQEQIDQMLISNPQKFFS